MKTLLLYLLSASAACATVIDVGSPGRYIEERNLAYTTFNGTPLEGQTLSIDLTFSDSVTFLRGTKFFGLYVIFPTDGQGFLGFTSGAGYFTDLNGNPLCEPLQADGGGYYGDSGSAVDGIISVLQTNRLTFNGAHFDLTLPNDPGVIITGGFVDLITVPSRFNAFVVGTVPDTGGTGLFLGVTLIGLALVWKLKL